VIIGLTANRHAPPQENMPNTLPENPAQTRSRSGNLNLPGRIVRHARRLIIRVGAAGDALERLLAARRAVQALAQGPPG
jgi:hypothetical protein